MVAITSLLELIRARKLADTTVSDKSEIVQTSLTECKRISGTYANRFRKHGNSFYSPASIFVAQGLERLFLDLLRAHNLLPLEGKRLLDVGSAGGFFLRSLLKYGPKSSDLFGVDIWEDRIREGRQMVPTLGLLCADGKEIPFRDETFDIVTQRTMFSSVLSETLRARIGREMLRVLKPGGYIFSFDFRVKRPGDHDVCAMTARRIMRIFPGCQFEFRSCGIPPPIVRMIAPKSYLLCELLSSIWVIGTHFWTVIRKPQQLPC